MEDCPLPINLDDHFTLNNSKSYFRRLEDSTVKIHKKTYIFVKEALEVNDIFRQTRATDITYYVKTFSGFSNKDLRKFEIKRTDGNLITDVDLHRLRKGMKIQIRGKFNNCKNCK